jgi:L-serine deaminase
LAKEDEMINVTFINNDGAGFADTVEVEDGTTAAQLFADQLGQDADPGAYLIRVNREACASNRALVNGDKMTVTPTKIDGAGGFDPVIIVDAD